MILELDTELLSKIEHLTINQLVFLNLVLGNNQANQRCPVTYQSGERDRNTRFN